MSADIVKLVSHLAQSTPPIKPVMHNSLNNRLSRRSKETNPEFEKTLNIAYKNLPGEDFEEGVLSSLESYYRAHYINQRVNFARRLEQARFTFIATFTLLIIGAVVMLVGIALFFLGNHQLSIVVVISGFIAEVAGFCLLHINKLLNDQLDESVKQIDTLAKTYDAMSYIDQITDPAIKGEAIEDLLKSIVNMKDVPSL